MRRSAMKIIGFICCAGAISSLAISFWIITDAIEAPRTDQYTLEAFQVDMNWGYFYFALSVVLQIGCWVNWLSRKRLRDSSE